MELSKTYTFDYLREATKNLNNYNFTAFINNCFIIKKNKLELYSRIIQVHNFIMIRSMLG